MKKSDSLRYELSKAQVIIIFVYYAVLLLGSGMVAVHMLCAMGEVILNDLMIRTVFSSLSVSGMMCSLQYIKRLYKACIQGRIVRCDSEVGSVGNFVYFILRPFYAAALVIVMIFAVLSGMFVVIGMLDYIINEKFLYLCVLLSCCIGYSTGQVLDRFEKISDEKILEIK